MTTSTEADEQAIRDVIATWLSATEKGDVDAVLSLMTDDAVFLVAGQPPMSKAEFETQSRAQAGKAGPRIEGKSDVEEVVVRGDVAFVRSKLTIEITPPGAERAIVRAGYAMTVFERVGGKWLLARDANLLVKVG